MSYKLLLLSSLGAATALFQAETGTATATPPAEPSLAGTVGATEQPVAQNPAAAAGDPASAINSLADIAHPITINRPYKFHFKKDDLGVKRATVELTLPVPTVEGVIRALKDEKQRDFILEVLADEVYKAARAQVGDSEKPVNKQDELDVSQLTLEFLANQPPAARRGGGIAKETWEEFAKDYVAVMPAVTGKTAEQVGNAAKLLVAKFQPVKTNKKVIEFLREQLALYITSTQNLEDFQECVEFLDNKADTLLQADEEKLLANL